MEKGIFNILDANLGMYLFLADGEKTKVELKDWFLNDCGVSESTFNRRVRSLEKGEIKFVIVKEGAFSLDKNAIKEMLSEVAAEFKVQTLEQVSKKKAKPEDDIPSVLSGHSPIFKQMQESVNDMGAMEKRYKAMLMEKDKEIARLCGLVDAKIDDLVVAYARQKILLLETMKTMPEELFQKDFFGVEPGEALPVDELMRHFECKVVAPFVPEFEAEQNLTSENYFRRIMKLLFEGDLLKKRWNTSKDYKQAEIKNSESETKEERKRLESINEILGMKNIPNQVKLSLYAAWFKEEDPEMMELLSFAGKYDINADYVIRLLEKPRDYRNYRTMRGMLQQVREASEVHIKREAAIELLKGDWYVEAEYMGKPCKFAMMPVDELHEFVQLLKNHDSKNAADLLENLLAENRNVIGESQSEKIAITVKGANRKKSKNVESREKSKIIVPTFLHAQDEGIDMHPPVDDDVAFDGFAEAEVKDGKQ